jgi:hypothetical protein
VGGTDLIEARLGEPVEMLVVGHLEEQVAQLSSLG